MTAIEKLNSIITSVDTLAQIADDCNFPAGRAIYNATASGRIELFAREDDFKALADAVYSPLHTVTSYNHIGDDVYKTTEMWFCYKEHTFTMIREEKYNG